MAVFENSEHSVGRRKGGAPQRYPGRRRTTTYYSGEQRGVLVKHAVIFGTLFFGLILLIVGLNRFDGEPGGNFTRSFGTGMRWSGDDDAYPSGSLLHNDRLLIVSHGRVMWYNVKRDAVDVLHENRGVYYGGFPGEGSSNNGTLWVVSRPHNWRPDTTAEYLLEIDAVTGEELQEVQIQSKFTHDVVRKGNSVYVADTGHGDIIVLDYPTMKERSRLKLFTLKQHVNTLSPTDDGHVWAMLHNLGESAMVKVDVQNGEVVQSIKDVGLRAHGVVQWKDGYMVFLDSDHGSLAKVQTDEESHARPETLWTVDMSEQKYYLKGLCIVDDIAYFGIAISQERKSRADESLNCQLAAFDLTANTLLWRRELPTRGLLNVVSAPHIHVESTAKAVVTSAHDDAGVGGGVELPPGDPLLAYPPQIGGYWDSGHPRLDNDRKNRETGFAGGVQMLLYKEDVSELKKALLQMPEESWSPEVQKKENAFLEGREGNLNQFKPGTSAIHLIFSDRQGENVFEFPWYSQKFASLLEPMLRRLLGKDVQNIIRVQFAKMPAHSEIKPHVDSGGYSEKGHRIHIVIASNPDVTFKVCERSTCLKLHTEEGLVFELNNRLKHFVKNDGDERRIHMVVDVSEQPQHRTKLSPGQLCHYNHGKIDC